MKQRYFEKIPGKKPWKRVEKEGLVTIEDLGEIDEPFY